MATITYDSKVTNQDAILKRIALSGYDSDKFLAPDNAYSKLPAWIQDLNATRSVTNVLFKFSF